jgi:predicted MFS family arabinose efflux permease
VVRNDVFCASLRLLFARRFGTFWFASFLSNIGTWAQQVAQPWLLLSLGASSFLLGLDSFAMGAPAVALLLVGGVLADRGDRSRVIVFFQSIQFFCPVLIVVLLLAHAVRPWMIILLSLVVGITDALSMPSFQSIVPSIVERAQIPAGIALNSTQFNLSRIAGPAIAGVLMATAGAVACFALSAVSYVPFILVAIWILPHSKRDPGGKTPAFDYRHLFEGVRDISREPALRGALLSVLATNLLCAPLITFCPVLIRDAFHEDVSRFSLTISALGIGGLAGAVGLLFVDPARDRRPLSAWFGACYGASLVLAALDPWPWALPAVFVLAGTAMAVSNISANSFLQASSPAGMRGQTVSLYMLAMRAGVSLGSLLTGASVAMLGVRHALLVNGVVALLAQAGLGKAWIQSPLPKAAS